jgi:alpha-1,3-rhamnosyl/mannosyltransferase
LLGFVPDEELARLYRGAAVFAYPSIFEGFGMPIVEALVSGLPVVASSHPSLDEACGQFALRADPGDVQAFAGAIEQALAGEAPTGGTEHAAQFTWRACGEAVLHGYESAL